MSGEWNFECALFDWLSSVIINDWVAERVVARVPLVWKIFNEYSLNMIGGLDTYFNMEVI
jgi:hypothetical protein